MGSDITRLEAPIVWFREGVGEGRAKGVSGHEDLRREEGFFGVRRRKDRKDTKDSGAGKGWRYRSRLR